MSDKISTKPIKVCHITSAHPRYDVRIFKKECKSLADNGYDVTLIVNDHLNDEVIDKVKIVSVRFKYKNRVERILKSKRRFFKKAIETDADIYHFHDPELLPLGNKLKRIGKKVVFDSHENYTMQIREKYYIPKLIRNIISKLYYIYETYSVKKIDAVIFPCTFNNINPFEKRANITVFINNVPILSELYDKYSDEITKDDRTLCYVGALTHDRGITHLIKATYKSNARLILGGTFTPKEYFNKVKHMKEFSCVDYRGYVDRNEVLEIYRNNKIGVCTILNVGQYNKSDNLATKVYEYMSMGLPVIISDYEYARNVIEKYKFGITIDPENVEEISEAINFLLSNPNISKEMGQAGRRAIREKFNWKIEEEKLLKLYGHLSS